MKRLVIAISLLLIMVALSGVTLTHLYYTQGQLLTKLDELSQAIGENDEDKSIQIAQEFSDLWLQKESMLTRYVRHTHIDTITAIAVQLPTLARYGDVALLASYITQLQTDIHHLWVSEIPTLHNLL